MEVRSRTGDGSEKMEQEVREEATEEEHGSDRDFRLVDSPHASRVVRARSVGDPMASQETCKPV